MVGQQRSNHPWLPTKKQTKTFGANRTVFPGSARTHTEV
jgi:hypothetical protein